MRKPPAVLNKIQTDSLKTQRAGYDIKTSIKKEKADLSESSSQENMVVQSEIKKEESETNAVQVMPEKKNTFFCKTCKITCGSRVELRRHKNSKRHVDKGVTY